MSCECAVKNVELHCTVNVKFFATTYANKGYRVARSISVVIKASGASPSGAAEEDLA